MQGWQAIVGYWLGSGLGLSTSLWLVAAILAGAILRPWWLGIALVLLAIVANWLAVLDQAQRYGGPSPELGRDLALAPVPIVVMLALWAIPRGVLALVRRSRS